MDGRFALLLLCFLLSGFSALLYQTAWTREFSFVFGTSELAVAAVLAGYMGGLALGSAAAARLAPRLERPVLVYGVLELGIAVSALAVPLGMRGLTAAYTALFGGGEELAEPGALATLFRLLGAFALMLTPTALMGATLPLLARHAVRRDEELGPRIGALYATNTAGAIGGTLCAAFLLLPALGLRETVQLGALVNGLVFLLAAALARGAPAPLAASLAGAPAAPGLHWILPLMLFSGAVSFAYEVLWTRLLSQLLGGSVYAFATMLASFLLGITLGSAIGGRVARRAERAAAGFAVSQLGVAALALSAFLLSDRLPALATLLGAGAMQSPLANAPLAGAVLLPVATCIGATFPLAVRVLAPDPTGAATATARVYAWNTVGAIVGSVGAGFLLLPRLGFEGTLQAGVVTSLSLAAISAWLARPRLPAALVAAAAGVLALLLVPLGPPWELLRASPLKGRADAAVRYFAVGRSATVLLLDHPGRFQLLTNGLPEAAIVKPSGIPGRWRAARWLGLLPGLLRPEAERALVVGLGGGVALEAVPPGVGAVDVVELEAEVLDANLEIGSERAVDPLAEPRVRVVVNDARGALLLTDRRYDAIVSQPSHPWTAGASHLYTREFFELARERLRDDGVFVQWIGLSFVDRPLLESLIATFVSVFPHVQVYSPVKAAVLFAASEAPLDVAAARDAIAASGDHFARHGIRAVEDLASALLLDTAGARAVAAGAPINTDDRNRLATGSARLGDGRLDFPALLSMVSGHDPLPGIAHELDGVKLARALLQRSQLDRAEALSGSLPELARQVVLGWIAAARNQPRLAGAHFREALRLGPDSLDAQLGIAVFAPAAASAVPRPDGILTLRRAQALDPGSEELRAMDPKLAAIARDSPLYDAAVTLRIGWRVRSGDPQHAAEALELIDEVLPRRDHPAVVLSRAEAARVAGRIETAWVALDDVSRRAGAGPQLAAVRGRALQLSQQLPDHPARAAIQARLSGRQAP